MAAAEPKFFSDEAPEVVERINKSPRWPCPVCGASNVDAAYEKCLEETGHHDCAHDVFNSLCPLDDLFEELE